MRSDKVPERVLRFRSGGTRFCVPNPKFIAAALRDPHRSRFQGLRTLPPSYLAGGCDGGTIPREAGADGSRGRVAKDRALRTCRILACGEGLQNKDIAACLGVHSMTERTRFSVVRMPAVFSDRALTLNGKQFQRLKVLSDVPFENTDEEIRQSGD